MTGYLAKPARRYRRHMLTQPSLFSDLPDAPLTDPTTDRRAGRRVGARKGFRSLPRFFDVYLCATKIGEAFAADAVAERLVKNYRRATIDVAVSDAQLSELLAAGREIEAFGHGFSTDRTGAVRQAVKAIRHAIERAQEDGELLPAPIKVIELSTSRRAVVLIESVLIRIAEQKGRLIAVAEAAASGRCDIDAIRYVLPPLIRPEEWVERFDQNDGLRSLRWAMVESDRRLTAAIKRAMRKTERTSGTEDAPTDPAPARHDGRIGRRARLRARRRKTQSR